MMHKIPGERRPQHLTTEMHILRSLTGTQSNKTDILYNNSDEGYLSLSLSPPSPSVLLCFKIIKTATETYQLLQQAHSEDAMGHTQVFDWFHRFKEGRTSVKSDPRSGRPSTSRNEEMIARVRTIVRNNRRFTVRYIADDCGISVG
jgi:hypothetical protein